MAIFDRFNIRVVAAVAGLCGVALALSSNVAAAPLMTGGEYACVPGAAGQGAAGAAGAAGRRARRRGGCGGGGGRGGPSWRSARRGRVRGQRSTR